MAEKENVENRGSPRVQRSLSVDTSSQSLFWKPVMVFYHPSMKKLAESVVDLGCRKSYLVILTLPPSTHFLFFYSFIKGLLSYAISFNGRSFVMAGQTFLLTGLTRLWGEMVCKITNKNNHLLIILVIFVASFHTPEVMFEELSLIYAFPRYYLINYSLMGGAR